MGDIITRLKQEIRQIYFDKPKIDSLIHTMQDRFGIPSGDAMDYIEERKKLEDASRFRHYAFAFAFDKLNDTDITKEFFTQVERSVMSKERETEETFEFPIRINCYPVTAQQWIGVSSVKFLMSLRDAQLINYNANTQRVMKRIIHNKSSSYRIAVNERAVKEIEKSFERGEFIPNTITINIPDTETDFYYDTKEKMDKAVDFWLYSYGQKYFVRWAVIDKTAGKAVGTIEMFRRPAGADFGDVGLIRLDVASAYEKAEPLREILSLIIPPAFGMFDCDEIISKVPIYAVERAEAFAGYGFTKTGTCLIGGNDGYAYNGYWTVRKK